MTYRQTLFFIGQCLTINLEEHNRVLVEAKLKNEKIDWEAVVKLSTKHYVFPALYLNFCRANFLMYLPSDLVEYMIDITNLNRERNTQIIEQAKEINTLLKAHNITPVFLKGTGNLLEGLYEDIGERMTRDIDLFVSKPDFKETITILKNEGYKRNENNSEVFHRHYPALVTKNRIAAIEIHEELLTEKYAPEFNYNKLEKNIQKINGVSVLSFEDQYCYTVFAHQINDYGYLYKSFSLRNGYDILLLSKKIETKNISLKFTTKTYKIINCFLAIVNDVFNEIDSITVIETNKKNKYLKTFYTLFFSEKNYKIYRNFIKIWIPFKIRLNIILKAFSDKKYRIYIIKKIKEKTNK